MTVLSAHCCLWELVLWVRPQAKSSTASPTVPSTIPLSLEPSVVSPVGLPGYVLLFENYLSTYYVAKIN